MTDITNRSDTPDIKEAEKDIRDIAKLGSIIPSRHCFRDSMAERNYNAQDLSEVLLKGKILEPPVYDEQYGDWKFKVTGITTEEDTAVVVTVIASHRELYCVTIYPK